MPRKDMLSMAELARIGESFIALGIKKIRLTGGEPLMRKGITELAERLGAHLGKGLDELTLTTNASHLAPHANTLKQAGLERINISLDTLNPTLFHKITGGADIKPVLQGIDAAQKAGLKVKINTLALKGINEQEIPALIEWAHHRNMEMTLIETMPLGDTGLDLSEHYLPLSEVTKPLSLTPINKNTGGPATSGPASYMRFEKTGGTIGLITPISENFCASCNRVRVSASGNLFSCLGDARSTPLRPLIRTHAEDNAPLTAAIYKAIAHKPKRHDFSISAHSTAPQLKRYMAHTGG